MSQHAKLSPSGAERWMNCPGSLAMEDGLPDTSSTYADEGTAAHFLASECLEKGKDPAEFLNREICVHPESGAFWMEAGDSVYKAYMVDGEMISHVRKYVNGVRGYAEDGEFMAEQRVPIGHLTGEEDAGGTSDAVVIIGHELQVHDLKYGMGVRVEAERNKQLMIYALGALEQNSMLYDIKHIRMVIHQPRLDHFPEWDCSVEELLVFGEEVRARAVDATNAFKFKSNWISNPDAAYLVPGEEQCKWCKAKAICPKLAEFVADTIECAFEDVTTGILPTEDSQYVTEVLGTKLKAVPLIEEWCKAIRGKVEAELLAGTPVPGFKLVQGKKGNRAWSNEAEAEALLKAMRVKHDQMYSYKLISPTTAEKLAKEEIIGKRQWPKVQEMITQSEGKPSVAPESDKRPALTIKPVADSFDDLTDEDLI